MQIIGCDLHSRRQTFAMFDTETGEVVEKVLQHKGNAVRDFYSAVAKPVSVGIEATGSMQWFLSLMEELKIECQVGHPATIRAEQKHDLRDAHLILKLFAGENFPSFPPQSPRRVSSSVPLPAMFGVLIYGWRSGGTWRCYTYWAVVSAFLVVTAERCWSGRTGLPAKQLHPKRVSGVRIPPSPPDIEGVQTGDMGYRMYRSHR